jgi:hypothetical protein
MKRGINEVESIMANVPRLLKAEEISCRSQQVNEYEGGGGGTSILLYKDARTDMTILDETFGPMNWQRQHHEIGGNLYCAISVWDADKMAWVVKSDVGVESNTEAVKGEASDSFKRAGTNWGIGRELYTAPDIYINLDASEIKKGASGKPQTTYKFGLYVAQIGYNDAREITGLVLIDKQGKVRFTYGSNANAKAAGKVQEGASKGQEKASAKQGAKKPVPEVPVPEVPANEVPAPRVSADVNENQRRKDELQLIRGDRPSDDLAYAAASAKSEMGLTCPVRDMTVAEFADFAAKVRKSLEG